MRVSVVVPAFNAESTIQRCIDSVRSQTTTMDVELVVVDDGSTDATCEVVRDSGDVLLVQQANAGPSAARNAGVAAASGELLAFLDADDTMTDGGLSARLEALDGRHALVMTSEAGRPHLTGPRQLQLRTLAFELGGIRGPSGWVLSRYVFDAVGGFDPRMRALEDFQFALKALSQGFRVELIETATFHYSGSGSGRAALGPSLLLLAQQALDSAWSDEMSPTDRRTLAKNYLGNAANVYARQRDAEGLRQVRAVTRKARIGSSAALFAARFPRPYILLQSARYKR